MSEEIKELLLKRAKSFAWRMGCMIGVALIAFIMEQLKLFELPPTLVAFLGLLAGEITKWLNNNVGLFGSRLK